MRFLKAIATWLRWLFGRARYGPQSRLFFWGTQHGRSWAAVAKVEPYGFKILRRFPENTWKIDFITSAASHGKNWILFRKSDSSGEIGLITADNEYVKPDHPPGGIPPFSVAAVDGNGVLLFVLGLPYDWERQKHRSKVTLAEILSDGSLFVGWSQELEIRQPDLNHGVSGFIGLDQGHAWLVSDSQANGSTVYILENGGLVGNRKWNTRWDGMTFHNGLLFVWSKWTKVGEICRIEPNPADGTKQIVTLSSLQFGEGDMRWDQIASAPSCLVAYEYPSSLVELRSLSQTAFPRLAVADTGAQLWRYIVRC